MNRSMVVAISVDEEEILERVECSSADEAGRAVANLLLRGYEYLHIDNLSALSKRSEAWADALVATSDDERELEEDLQRRADEHGVTPAL